MQFPVVPAEAITIHKSQGATYSKVVVHTSPGMQRAALYVACSRATRAAGLNIIVPFVPPRSAQDSASEEELRELLSAKLLNTHFDCLLIIPNLHAFFHNTESLHCQTSDVCSDQLTVKSSLLCFVEASTYWNDAYDISGFTPVVRLDCQSVASGARPKRGILLFIRSELFENVSLCSSGRCFANSTNLASPVFEFATFKYRSLGIIEIYKTYPLIKFETEFKDLIQRYTFLNSNCLVLGNFNLCLHSISSCCLSVCLDACPPVCMSACYLLTKKQILLLR